MRPISVLQEFAKVASKILTERLGQILAEHPYVLNQAQRGFLKNGCINQCITTALNIFEDAKEKRKKKGYFMLFHMTKRKPMRVFRDTLSAHLLRDLIFPRNLSLMYCQT